MDPITAAIVGDEIRCATEVAAVVVVIALERTAAGRRYGVASTIAKARAITAKIARVLTEDAAAVPTLGRVSFWDGVMVTDIPNGIGDARGSEAQ